MREIEAQKGLAHMVKKHLGLHHHKALPLLLLCFIVSLGPESDRHVVDDEPLLQDLAQSRRISVPQPQAF